MNQFWKMYIAASWKTAKLYERVFAEVLERFDLTPNEKDVLLFLYNNEGYDTASDIVRHRSISKSLVSKSIDSLGQRGYLNVRQDEVDRRIMHLILTDEARMIAKELKAVQEDFFKMVGECFTREEGEQFLLLIEKLIDNVERHL
jgi:DNA-binding MarR family transcriptional regulator